MSDIQLLQFSTYHTKHFVIKSLQQPCEVWIIIPFWQDTERISNLFKTSQLVRAVAGTHIHLSDARACASNCPALLPHKVPCQARIPWRCSSDPLQLSAQVPKCLWIWTKNKESSQATAIMAAWDPYERAPVCWPLPASLEFPFTNNNLLMRHFKLWT